MKKKYTTIMLSMLMVMISATAGVSALPAAPEDNKADNSEYWTVEAAEVTESSALIVWNTADEDYRHQEDAVFNISVYEVNGEESKVLALNVMSGTAAAGQGEDPHVYVFNDDAQAKDGNGKSIPLGYSFTLENLDPDTGYEIVVEKAEEGDYKTSGKAEFRTKTESTETAKDEPAPESGGTKLSTAAAGYTLTPGGVYERKSPTTAEFRWWMNREPEAGASVTINGRKVKPTKNSDGTYSYHVTGLDPGRVYKIPVAVVDSNGATVSNVMDVWVDKYYKLTPGGVYERRSPTTAEFRWWMSHDATDGASVTINGRKVKPSKNSDGTYSYNVSGLDPGRVYKIPVAVVDSKGRTLSNVMDVWVDKYYKLTPGGVYARRSPTTAEFRWWMNHEPADGASVTINGRKVKPTKNSDGSYSYNVSGLDPAKVHKIPVAIVDRNGRTISNVLNIWVDSYYKLTPGGVYERRSPTTAEFRWWMNHEPEDGASVTINGRKVKPTKNSDGTYSYHVTGLDPGRVYKIPVKIVDRNGRTLSNVMDVWVDKYYKLTPGGVYARRSPTTAEFRWWMNHDLEDGSTVTINGRKVRPTKNSDGSYSYNVSGLDPARVYKIPVAVVDSSGRTLSNVMDVWVDTYYKLSAGKAGTLVNNSSVFSWKMNRELEDGASVTINGRKVKPTKNSDGSYSYKVTGLSPDRAYDLPVTVVDKNGKVISNVLNIFVGTLISFNETTEITLDLGKTTRLGVRNNSSALRWSSNHPDVVSVDGDGRITSLRPGRAVISATTAFGSRAMCSVRVSCDGGLVSRDTLTSAGAAQCSKLMIVAHPDDESIFGGHNLREGGWLVVCITNGYNPVRADEFRNTLLATGNKGIILDYPDYQDGEKDDWTYVKNGISADISRMVDYKQWEKIVTHNKWGEYGHIHHKMTHAIVKKECQDKPAYDNLYYFGKYYGPGEIPKSEKRLSNEDLNRKLALTSAYHSQRGAIQNLEHIIPYENWLKASSVD